MIKAFKVINTDSPELKFVQDNVDYALRSVAAEPMISGNILKGIPLTSTTKNIPHGLNRPWSGFFVTKSTLDVNVFWDSATDSNKQKESTIALKSSATATVDLYIF